MTTAQSLDLQARLTVQLRDFLVFLEEGGLQEHSVNLMNEKIDAHESVEFLKACAAYGNYDGFQIEKKILGKRIRSLEADKNSDPELILKLTNARADIEAKKTKALMEALKYKYVCAVPVKTFENQTAHQVYFEKMGLEKFKESLASHVKSKPEA